MKSSRPTYPGVNETTPNPYPPSSFMAPQSHQPLGFINLGNRPQIGQLPFIISPGTFASSQLGQGNAQMLNPTIGKAATNFKEEAKALGAIQIIIGLMHFGFGIILGLLSVSHGHYWGFASTAFVGGYPLWGGLSFIISGSLSVSASKEFNPCLIKGSLGMNVVSAIFALTGVCLLLRNMIVNDHINKDYWLLVSGKGISGILMIFSLLEFGINCTTAHFANQSITNTNRSVMVFPNAYATNPMTQEPCPPAPRYDDHIAHTHRC